MQYTSKESVTLLYELAVGVDNNFTITNTHFIVSNGVQTASRLYADELVIVQPYGTRPGSITATVTLELGISTIKLQLSSSEDLDKSNVDLETIATATVMRVIDLETIEV